MELFNNLASAFVALLSWQSILVMVVGVILGILGGAMPGISPSTAVALLVPFSFTMDARLALIMLVAIYQAANYGGAITAVLINTPGTPSTAATCFDGYPLTQQGKAGKALGIALLGSCVGGIVAAIILILFCVPLARVALKFSPAAYFGLAIFGLATVASLGGGNIIKAIVAVLIGLLIKTIGLDPIAGINRFTFGSELLYDGFALIPALLGLFAVSAVFEQFEKWTGLDRKLEKVDSMLPSFKETWKLKRVYLQSSIIGTIVGIFPGAGATIASFISYDVAKRTSKEPEKFGKGSLEGLAAPETADSSSVGGALIPLLALGIPGSATDAVLIGAFILHDLVPGPLLFRDHPGIVYGIFASLLVVNILVYLIGLYGNRAFIKMVCVSDAVLYPLILVVALIGTYSVNNSLFDMGACIGFGFVGWILKRYGYPVAPVVLGIVLGKLIEYSFRRGVIMGGYTVFFTDKLAFVVLLLATLSLSYPLISAGWSRLKKGRQS
ncbi:MAG: tripartite tricarboxylate transporter permease [Thermodesulfobacteriota bacterium]|nr:tripartite tricarboxylate transporter permease [Thermodesulfobacteriota bacterium]